MTDRIAKNRKMRKNRSKVKFRLKLVFKDAVKTAHVQISTDKVLAVANKLMAPRPVVFRL